MAYCRNSLRPNIAAVTAIIIIAFALADTARSQTDQGPSISRGVRIIDSPTPSHGQNDQSQPVEPPETAIPAPLAPATSPAVGGALLTAPVPPQATIDKTNPAPPLLTPGPVPSMPLAPADARASSGNFANVPSSAKNGSPPKNMESLLAGVKVPNAAGLSMQILPGPDVMVGSPISFQVSSQQAGYLILVDVDANGKLVQVYPNPMSLLATGGARANSNFLRPGKTLQIPDRTNPYNNFQFIASPPSGAAMVIALLSDRPVQMVDLPDVPDSLLGGTSAVDYLTKFANELRIPNASKNQLEEPHWSFDAKFYSIR